MSDDKDLIRVDLLKFRRKAYLSYLEGSPERKSFLKIILQNELQLTAKEMPHDLINSVVEGHRFVFWDSIKKFVAWAALAIFFGFAYFNTHLFSFSSVFIIMGVVCFGISVEYLHEYWLFRKSLKKVTQYSNDMKKYMNRISNEIKRLDGPR